MVSKKEIFEFVKRSLEEKSNTIQKFTLSELSEQIIKEIEQLTGEDVSDYKRIIDNYAINHVLKKHGTNKESLRGQVKVDDDDFENIPEITENYDKLSDGGKNKLNNKTVKFEKNLEKGNYIYIEEIRKGKKELNMQTMYIKKPSKKD